MVAETALVGAAGKAAETVAAVKLPSSAAVLVILIGAVALAIGYYGPGNLALKSDRFAGPAQQQGGGGGGGGGGAR